MTTLYEALESKATLDSYVRKLTTSVFFDGPVSALESFIEFPPLWERFDGPDFAVTKFKSEDGVLKVEGYYTRDIDTYFEYTVSADELVKFERGMK